MILTCIILKIKAQLNQLVNWKLWVTLFYPEQWVEFLQNLRLSQALKENLLRKIFRSEFLQSSFIFVIHLLKEIYRKIMNGKTRYDQDRTETGS